MKAHLVTDKEGAVSLLTEWWDAHGHPRVPAYALPQVSIFVSDDDDEPLAFGVLYECNSAPIAWVEWVTTNPANTPLTSAKAIKVLVDFLVLEASHNGYAILLSTCRQKSLGRLLEKSGFVKTDDEVSHFIRITTL